VIGHRIKVAAFWAESDPACRLAVVESRSRAALLHGLLLPAGVVGLRELRRKDEMLASNKRVVCWAASGHDCRSEEGAGRPNRNNLEEALAPHLVRLGQGRPYHQAEHLVLVEPGRQPVSRLSRAPVDLRGRAALVARPGRAASQALEQVLH